MRLLKSKRAFIAALLASAPVTALAQSYPLWFLREGDLPCTTVVTGLEEATTSAEGVGSAAMKEAYTRAAMNSQCRLTGTIFSWVTEDGMTPMENSVVEVYDTSAAERFSAALVPLDTFRAGGTVGVLLAEGECSVPNALRKRVAMKGAKAPEWVTKGSAWEDKRYLYAAGISEEYYPDVGSWRHAEQMARLFLARSIRMDIASKVTKGGQYQELVSETIDVMLSNIRVAARWLDVKTKTYYVLIRMPRR